MPRFADLYREYEARCGDRPARPRDDLWQLLWAGRVWPPLLGTSAYAVAFWTLVFGDARDGAWADASRDWPSDAQWAAFRAATAPDGEDGVV